MGIVGQDSKFPFFLTLALALDQPVSTLERVQYNVFVLGLGLSCGYQNNQVFSS